VKIEQSPSRGMIDVDFSLAIHNRTGKFFIGKDILENNSDLIRTVFYGRLPSANLPGYLPGRLAGRFFGFETERRLKGKKWLPRIRRRRPVLHLDPLTTLNYDLGEQDIVVVHDLGPVTHPHLFTSYVAALYEATYQHIARRPPVLVFVSNATRLAYRRLYGSAAQEHVIYPQIRSFGPKGSPVQSNGWCRRSY
jgi:hypothetical protein